MTVAESSWFSARMKNKLRDLAIALSDDRVIVRYSSGCPSAVVAKICVSTYGAERVTVTKSDTRSEHEDNERFDREVEQWIGAPIVYLASDEYVDIWDVFEKERFIVSHQGAKCRGVLKMAPFYDFYRPSDMLAFGYTADRLDAARADRLRSGSVEQMMFPLIERGLTKGDCKALVDRAGIKLPAMYLLGFRNNNCRGCPKGGMGYWNLVRQHFPADFERMCLIQDELGPGSWFLVRRGERISLRMLRPEDGKHDDDLEFECSTMCALTEETFVPPA